MDIERLRTDPAYWDEVAPEGAEFAARNTNLGGIRWYRNIGENYYEYCSDDDADWDDSDGSPVYEYFPRPSQPQWRGPEDGLPPVGVECEAYVRAETANQGAPGNKWLRGVSVGEAVAPNGGVGGLLKAEDGKVHFIGAFTHFRPLKSDKERAVEAAMATDPGEDLGPCSRRQFCEGLYDAGLLKLPEDTQ